MWVKDASSAVLLWGGAAVKYSVTAALFNRSAAALR